MYVNLKEPGIYPPTHPPIYAQKAWLIVYEKLKSVERPLPPLFGISGSTTAANIFYYFFTIIPLVDMQYD